MFAPALSQLTVHSTGRSSCPYSASMYTTSYWLLHSTFLCWMVYSSIPPFSLVRLVCNHHHPQLTQSIPEFFFSLDHCLLRLAFFWPLSSLHNRIFVSLYVDVIDRFFFSRNAYFSPLADNEKLGLFHNLSFVYFIPYPVYKWLTIFLVAWSYPWLSWVHTTSKFVPLHLALTDRFFFSFLTRC